MLRFALASVAVAALAAVFTVREAPRWLGGGNAPEVVEVAAARSPPPPRLRSGQAALNADARGHFLARASVNGRSVQFLVDTGATIVALDETTARRLNFRPSRTEFRYAVQTANGEVKVAPVMLGEVRVGAVAVRDVEAVVMPDGALEGNLLGMSFLKRLRAFSVEGGRLILTQ